MIYYQPAVAFDQYRKPWSSSGQEQEDPTNLPTPERFYAVKDDAWELSPNRRRLANVTSAPQNTFDVDPPRRVVYPIGQDDAEPRKGIGKADHP